jgi:hypothetical protein
MKEKDHSRANQNPQNLRTQKPSDERRDIIGIEFAERFDCEPFEAEAGALPEAGSGF